MARKEWPTRDREWATQYRASMGDERIPAAALHEREEQLLSSVRVVNLPAAELFGEASVLAKKDSAELATVDGAVRVSAAGGLRPALLELGRLGAALGAVGALFTLGRSGWFVNIDVAIVLIGVSIALSLVGWVAIRALFAAGRLVVMTGATIIIGALILVSIALAASVGPGVIAATDVPVPLFTLALIAPGGIIFLLANRMAQKASHEVWDDAEWLRRFRSGLRSRLMPAVVARTYVAKFEQVIATANSSAGARFGHPLTLARKVADADESTRARRWWMSTVVGMGLPIIVAISILLSNSWGKLTVPTVTMLFLIAVLTPTFGWADRPWAQKK